MSRLTFLAHPVHSGGGTIQTENRLVVTLYPVYGVATSMLVLQYCRVFIKMNLQQQAVW